jgi:hypothetical protein
MKFVFTFVILSVLSPFCGMGQLITRDTIPENAVILYDIMGNKVVFEGEMPPLNQVEGAPKAFYTYYWEFGDGNYSFKEKPVHTYKKEGTYETKLWATNNYDNGKPPSSRPKSITIKEIPKEASNNTPTSFLEGEDLILKRNREPLPGEEFVLVASYKNTSEFVTSGKIYLYYNEAQFKHANFTVEDTRMYHNEVIIPEPIIAAVRSQYDYTLYASTKAFVPLKTITNDKDSSKRKNLPLTLEESKAKWRNHQIIQFDNMQPGEERNLFRTIKTTPEMIKDTTAIVTLRSIYVPDDNSDAHSVKDTEMEIVTSHDPNKMSTNGRSLNYRLARYKRVEFKVRFQNNGEGPANTIKLEIDTPDMFDKSTLRVDGMYPECPICPKDIEVDYSCLDTLLQKDKIIFQYNRIYLPGSDQKNVEEKDSTKGFVKYSMKFGKKAPKKKTTGRTAIYFDKNEPIFTNKVITKFTPGISVGAKLGYRMVSELDNYSDYFIGATLSPYKSQKGYFQAELLVSNVAYDKVKTFGTSTPNAVGGVDSVHFSELNQFSNIAVQIVPGSYRYSFSSFFAIGAGLQMKLDLASKKDQETTGEAFVVLRNGGFEEIIPNQDLDSFETAQINENYTNFQTGLFVGLNLGNVRIGPSVGVRYEYNFNTPNSGIQFYGIWKF